MGKKIFIILRSKILFILTYVTRKLQANPLFHNNAVWRMPLKYHVFENIMENGANAPKEQMLHFP